MLAEFGFRLPRGARRVAAPPVMSQLEQSTATARAAHTWRIRSPANRPSRSTSTAMETLSTESRLTAQRRGIGSSPGSSNTSLASPRIVVVQGATSARRCRGMTESRDMTTTGRRPISAISHHQSSPLAGSSFTMPPRPGETMRDRPTRRVRRADARRTPRSSHRSRRRDVGQATRRAPGQSTRHLYTHDTSGGPAEATSHPPSCSAVCDSCHQYGTYICHEVSWGD